MTTSTSANERRRKRRYLVPKPCAYKTEPIYYSLIFCAISFNYFSSRLFHFSLFDSPFFFSSRLESPNAVSRSNLMLCRCVAVLSRCCSTSTWHRATLVGCLCHSRSKRQRRKAIQRRVRFFLHLRRLRRCRFRRDRLVSLGAESAKSRSDPSTFASCERFSSLLIFLSIH